MDHKTQTNKNAATQKLQFNYESFTKPRLSKLIIRSSNLELNPHLSLSESKQQNNRLHTDDSLIQ